jgi:SAM-dependent methyltransferase
MEPDEYHKMAAVEDAMWYYRALHAHLHRELAVRLAGRPARILDAGCGSGGLIRRLSAVEPAWTWTGLDVSPLACELARTRCRAEIHEASVTALPFPDGMFDAVVSADVLYHVEDDAAALREIARVLRPGGVAVINVPAHRWLWSYHDVATHSKRRYERQELRAKLVAAGLAAVRLTHWNMLPLPLLIVRRKLLPAPRGGSDVQLYPAPVERVFRVAMAVERAGVRTGINLPLGSSILAVGMKQAMPLPATVAG